MPSSWPDIDPTILHLLIDGGEELIKLLWHTIRGESTDDDETKIDKIRRKAQEAFVRKIQEELEQEAAAANLTMQLLNLGPAQQHVLDAFDRVDATFPKINEILDITEIAPGTEVPPPEPGYTRFEGTIDEGDK